MAGKTQTTSLGPPVPPPDDAFTRAEHDEIMRLHIIDGLIIGDAIRHVYDKRSGKPTITVQQDAEGQWYYLSSDPFVDGQPVGQIRPQWVEEAMKRGNDMSDASTTTCGSLPIGTRVRYISDVRLSGVIEEYEFPGMLGMVFVRVNGGSGFWFHHFQIVKDVIH